MPSAVQQMVSERDETEDEYIAAVARFPDEVGMLEKAGADLAVDSVTEAGAGFADHVEQHFAAQLARLGLPKE